MTARITLTVADSDRDHVRYLAALNRPDLGILSVRIRPGMRRFGWLTRDILTADSVDLNLNGSGQYNLEEADIIPARFAVTGITDLIVTGVEAIGRHLTDTILLAYAARLHLWLVADHVLPASVADALEHWPVNIIDQAAFDKHWTIRTSVAPSDSGDEDSRWPNRVPGSDFPTFLNDSRQLLDPAHAALVAACWNKTRERTRLALAETDDPDGTTITDILRTELANIGHLSEAITVARAVQAAAFDYGWHIRIDPETFRAAGDHTVAISRRDPNTWQMLRRHVTPLRPAVCAALAAGGDTTTLRKVTVADVAEDGSIIHTEDGPLVIPPGGRQFLATLRLHRMSEGAAGADPLFATGDWAVPDRRFAGYAADAATELGVTVTAGRYAPRSDTQRRWLRRHGITITPLPTAARTKPA